jgi:hypothetical protein
MADILRLRIRAPDDFARVNRFHIGTMGQQDMFVPRNPRGPTFSDIFCKTWLMIQYELMRLEATQVRQGLI